MKKAATYIRVSTDKQRDEQTSQTQVDEVKMRVASDGNMLTDDCIYIDEGWSGAYLERPALDQMRQDARQGKFEILYVYDKGRLSRRFVHQEIVIDDLRAYSIEFVSLHDINGTSPEERVMGGVMGLFHEYERVKTAERFRLAKLSKVRNGNLLGYNPPYGYDYIPVQGKGLSKVNGRFVINEQEAEVIRMLFDWVGNEGLSLRQARKRLHELKIPPRKAKQATWTTGPLIRLLKNESYIGKHHYYKSESCLPKYPKPQNEENRYKHRHTNKTSRLVRPREEWLEVEVPVIVDKDLFDKVQARLELNTKFSHRNNKRNNYLLTGLLACTCGQSRTGDPGANGNLYYRCTNRLHRYPLQRTCAEGGVSATILDALVWQNIQTLLSNPDRIKAHADKWLQTQQKAAEAVKATDLEQLSQKLIAEEQRYAKAYGAGLMSEEVYDERMRDVLQRRKNLARKVEKAEAAKSSNIQISPKELAEQTSSLLKDLDFTDKKDIIRTVIQKIEVNQKEATVWGLIPLLSDGKVGLYAKHRYTYCVTQQPFELKLTMPPTNRGKRGYSDEYVAELQKQLTS